MASLAQDLKLALDRVSFARRLGMEPDSWQEDLLRSASERGSSTAVGSLASPP